MIPGRADRRQTRLETRRSIAHFNGKTQPNGNTPPKSTSNCKSTATNFRIVTQKISRIHGIADYFPCRRAETPKNDRTPRKK
ncbi:MAG TPA: hypothetical protein DEB39_10545 [Planctomycetaceae bacterium]|nr:hypothetical protein [Planctomycetaceae bacterium]